LFHYCATLNTYATYTWKTMHLVKLWHLDLPRNLGLFQTFKQVGLKPTANFSSGPTLVEINQNVSIPFTITCDFYSFVTRFGNICNYIPNLNYFGHFHNYDATIKNFILLVGSILHLFSSINRLICPINRNSCQISYILKVFYNDIGVYFNVCIKIIYIYIKHAYVCIFSYNESQNWYLNSKLILLNLKISISILKNLHLNFK
jgi:hypothetical protein